jgi:hypothetical protein
VLVECGPGSYEPSRTHPKSAFICATMLKGAIRSQVNEGPVITMRPDRAFPNCLRSQRPFWPDETCKTPRDVRGGNERDGTDDPSRDLRLCGFTD